MVACSIPVRIGIILLMATAATMAADPPPEHPPATPLNILLITADDMNYDALGVTGSRTPDITPNLDHLASQSMRFTHAHVTIAVCQPSRSVLMTGRYPSRNGALGFEPIHPSVPTLQESLRRAGYLNGILGKTSHLQPENKFCWDMLVGEQDLGRGRDPNRYYEASKRFFQRARTERRPFFLMANSHDPHRPFAGSDIEKAGRPRDRRRGIEAPWPPASRYYRPDEVPVPPFLPDLPDIRKEVAQYYSSVHRCDETVGLILQALRESGAEESTLVMFLSDNGMAFPFAKTNCYLTSTRTPWMVRWPGRVKPATVEDRHFISGIDFMPTILEAAGLPQVAGLDGRSFVPVLDGKPQDGRDRVFTVFHRTSGRQDFPMRCLQDRRFGYILNSWSDGQRVFKNESQSGLTFAAMQEAAKTDEKIAARVRLFLNRVPEEFYDFAADPAALHNLIDDPAYAEQVARYRTDLRKIMKSIDDPLLARNPAGE